MTTYIPPLDFSRSPSSFKTAAESAGTPTKRNDADSPPRIGSRRPTPSAAGVEESTKRHSAWETVDSRDVSPPATPTPAPIERKDVSPPATPTPAPIERKTSTASHRQPSEQHHTPKKLVKRSRTESTRKSSTADVATHHSFRVCILPTQLTFQQTAAAR